MPESTEPSSELTPEQLAICRWKRMRLISILVISLLAATSAWSHLQSPADARRLAGKRVKVVEVLSAESIRIQSEDGQLEELQLLGITEPGGNWSAASQKYLQNRIGEKFVVIQYDGTQVRTKNGKLLALIYPTVNECINISMVQYGQAFVDRRVQTYLNSQLSQMENEARKKSRGFWSEMQDSDQPAWRIEWLRKRRSTSSPSGS